MTRRAAVYTIVAAAGFDLIGAVWFAAVEHLPVTTGIYWSVTTATTVGYGDITPHTHIGRFIAVLVMLTVIPLFAATFSLLTTSLTTMHVSKLHDEALAHIRHLKEHLGVEGELPDHLVPPHLRR
ncbi:MAG TPA: potassium channel family protein [Mycobacteriales bacterium]|nr:potassium channel family protein [Mycobacteriales bacterium]